MKTLLSVSLLSVIFTLGASSQSAAKPDTPKSTPIKPTEDINADLRSRVAIAQRNYLAAQNQMTAATKELQDVFAEANPACEKLGKLFDAASVSCQPKPAPPPAK